MSTREGCEARDDARRHESNAIFNEQGTTFASKDGKHRIELDNEDHLAMERSLYQQQRRLPHRGGVSYERMMFLERVFESRSAPTDYDEALADKILRIDAILEMFQGRRCSLIQQHQLLDCSLTEKAAARVQEAIRRSDKDYTAISSNDPSHADQLCPFVAPQTDSLAEAHIRDEQPEKPPRFESLNFGTSKLSRKRPASPRSSGIPSKRVGNTACGAKIERESTPGAIVTMPPWLRHGSCTTTDSEESSIDLPNLNDDDLDLANEKDCSRSSEDRRQTQTIVPDIPLPGKPTSTPGDRDLDGVQSSESARANTEEAAVESSVTNTQAVAHAGTSESSHQIRNSPRRPDASTTPRAQQILGADSLGPEVIIPRPLDREGERRRALNLNRAERRKAKRAHVRGRGRGSRGGRSTVGGRGASR